MTEITYKQSDGSQVVVEGANGDHLMKIALDNGVQGIIGSCGGSCMCATCHVTVDLVIGKLNPISDMEAEILDMEVEDVQQNSRLCCQIKASDDIQAISVTVMDAE